ncbi:MAG: hypothetical protein JWO36_2543 [Myxococcales bacterium]|nr:hypothetical protein [Myxococcales bacterium]
MSFDTIPRAIAALHTLQHGVPMVVPGDPAASRLFTVLSDSSKIMPPDVPLPQADIALIERWIAAGATGLQ